MAQLLHGWHRRCSLAVAPLASCLLLTRTVDAEPPPHALKNTSTTALALESGGAIVVFAAYSIASGDVPTSCKWCEPTSFDVSARNAFLMKDSKWPGWISHGFSLGAIPIGGYLGLMVPALDADKGSYALQDAWIMANVFVLTTGITDGTKKLIARKRPGFYYGRSAMTEAEDYPKEENLSFFSGDTAWAFSFGATASTLAYLRGYSTAPWITLGSSVLAVSTAILRMSGDMHWATDVMTGAAVGTGVGIAVPLLLHSRLGDGSSVSFQTVPVSTPAFTGVSLSGAF